MIQYTCFNRRRIL